MTSCDQRISEAARKLSKESVRIASERYGVSFDAELARIKGMAPTQDLQLTTTVRVGALLAGDDGAALYLAQALKCSALSYGHRAVFVAREPTVELRKPPEGVIEEDDERSAELTLRISVYC